MTIIAQYVFYFLIAEDISAGPIDFPDPVAGGFHQGQEPFSAVRKHFLNFFQPGDILNDCLDAGFFFVGDGSKA